MAAAATESAIVSPASKWGPETVGIQVVAWSGASASAVMAASPVSYSNLIVPLGLLSSVDQDNFAVLAVAIERWGRAQQRIIEFGEVIRVKDRPQLSPWLRVAAEAEATIVRIGAEFGLSPSARTRLFASPLAPIPAPVTVEQPDIAESFFQDDTVN